jgi:hypothetical protein
MPIESNAVVGEVHGTRETIAVSQDIFGMELFSTVEQPVLSSGLTQIPPDTVGQLLRGQTPPQILTFAPASLDRGGASRLPLPS